MPTDLICKQGVIIRAIGPLMEACYASISVARDVKGANILLAGMRGKNVIVALTCFC